jgi:peptidyl-prolyl cis-trans isomerase B (cyclophilin B)
MPITCAKFLVKTTADRIGRAALVAGKKERQRMLARQRYERRLAREAQRQERARRIARITGIAVVVAALLVVVTLVALHLTSNAKASASGTPSAAASTPASTPTPTSTGPVTKCVYTPNPPAARNVGFPPAKPDLRANYQATITTNRGTIVIDLLNSKAPCTVNSFVFLAVKKYFNNTICHRLTTTGIYVLQCGDPTGTGSGGPGYKFNDENLAGARYPQGVVAMANSGPNTNGSQFFLVYRYSPLPPDYTPFGQIVSGLNVIQSVAKAGSDNANGPGDGHPREKVVIESVTIKKT